MAKSARTLGKSWRVALVLLGLALVATSSGCVRRRLTIRSNPPGALVYVDNQEIGFTPVSTPYVYYGTRNIRLVKDGYETLSVKQKFKAPLYEIPPIDFVSENLWPGELRDERTLDFQLVPQQIVPTERLLERAQGMRGNVQQGSITPLLNPAPAAGAAPAGAPAGPAMQTLPPGGVPLP